MMSINSLLFLALLIDIQIRMRCYGPYYEVELFHLIFMRCAALRLISRAKTLISSVSSDRDKGAFFIKYTKSFYFLRV